MLPKILRISMYQEEVTCKNYDIIIHKGMKSYLALHAGAPKRKNFNKHQRSLLEASFRVQFFPNKTMLKELALQSGLEEKSVLRWFKSKRHKLRGIKGDERRLCLSVYMYVDNRNTIYEHTCIFALFVR